MSKIRIIFAEAEGDEAVMAALGVLNDRLKPEPLEPVITSELPFTTTESIEAADQMLKTMAGKQNGNGHKSPKKVRRAIAPAAPKEAPAGAEDGKLSTQITAVLQKHPLTSKEIHEKLGGNIGSIYDALHRMRKAGLIQSVTDESDGQRKNCLVGGSK